MNPANIRKTNLITLSKNGFQVSPSLPLSDHLELRSYNEIASRLFALDALVCWVVFTQEQTASELIKGYIDSNQLTSFMTDEELHILSLEREEAHQQFVDTIGWRLENMWALAWVLGFPIKPNVNQGQLSDDVVTALMYDFLPGLNSTVDDLLMASEGLGVEQVIELEDLYYCAHNAVRSAQMGETTVPENYHPIIDGGAVHERRHSLTWCLSPNVAWQDTDLST